MTLSSFRKTGRVTLFFSAVVLVAVGAGVIHNFLPVGNSSKAPSEDAGSEGHTPAGRYAAGAAEASKHTPYRDKLARQARLSAAVRRNRRSAAAEEAYDEAAVMETLKTLLLKDPETTFRLAREGNERFPDSERVAERDWYAVRSLVEMGRFNEAVAEAKQMVERYPGNFYARDVRRHLLSHPLTLDR